MNVSDQAVAIGRLDGFIRAIWRSWSGERAARLARALALGACATLSLHAAATVEVVYTLRVPYVLFGAAVATGLPFVVRGWARAPSWTRWSAFALLCVYAVAAVAGGEAELPFQRAGSHRDLVYLADLVLGLGVIGLVLGLWPTKGGPVPLVPAIALGAFAAAGYGVYQWFAQEFGLPLADLNNAVGTAWGPKMGGGPPEGVLGWGRIHGTFPEPHSFGAYLAACLPLCALVTMRARGGARLAAALGLAVVGIAFLLTGTLPAWAALAVAVGAGATLLCVARGWTAPAALAGAVLVLSCLAAPALLSQPAVLAKLTSRSAATIEVSTHFRTETWVQVRRLWTRRPVLGHGPGQSSVRLAQSRIAESGVPDDGLPSAQGVWAASLLDAGVLGVGAWALFLGGVLAVAAAGVVRRPDQLALAAFTAMLAAVVLGQLGEDRLDISAWAFIGLGLAMASRGHPHSQGDSREQ